MTPVEFQDLWIASLRSGKYQQAFARLRSGHGMAYCCLGVACDLYDPSKWQGDSYGLSTCFLSMEVADALGSPVTRPSVHLTEAEATPLGLGFMKPTQLSDLNDLHGWTFDRIADFIETYRERIFTNAD